MKGGEYLPVSTEPSCIRVYVLLSQRVLLSVGTETCSSEDEPLEGALQSEMGKKSLFPPQAGAAAFILILLICSSHTVVPHQTIIINFIYPGETHFYFQ